MSAGAKFITNIVAQDAVTVAGNSTQRYLKGQRTTWEDVRTDLIGGTFGGLFGELVDLGPVLPSPKTASPALKEIIEDGVKADLKHNAVARLLNQTTSSIYSAAYTTGKVMSKRHGGVVDE